MYKVNHILSCLVSLSKKWLRVFSLFSLAYSSSQLGNYQDRQCYDSVEAVCSIKEVYDYVYTSLVPCVTSTVIIMISS